MNMVKCQQSTITNTSILYAQNAKETTSSLMTSTKKPTVHDVEQYSKTTHYHQSQMKSIK